MKSRFIYENGEIIYAQRGDDVLVDKLPKSTDPGYLVMVDIQPYRSMVDGSVINSRSTHRRHLKQHGCEEIGNDSSLTRKPQPLKSPPGLKEVIIAATHQHNLKEI